MLSLSMVLDYLQENPNVANNQLRRTRASTKSFINNFKLVYKHRKDNKIVYDFDGDEHSIHIETDEDYEKIVKISCGKGENIRYEDVQVCVKFKFLIFFRLLRPSKYHPKDPHRTIGTCRLGRRKTQQSIPDLTQWTSETQ